MRPQRPTASHEALELDVKGLHMLTALASDEPLSVISVVGRDGDGINSLLNALNASVGGALFGVLSRLQTTTKVKQLHRRRLHRGHG